MPDDTPPAKSPASAEKLKKILQHAGASPVDPLSRQALEYFLEGGPDDTDDEDLRPLSVIDSAPRLRHHVSDLTSPQIESQSTATTAGSYPSEVMAQLRLQTQLIQQLQRQVQELTEAVARIDRERSSGTAVANDSPVSDESRERTTVMERPNQGQAAAGALRQSRLVRIVLLFLAMRRRQAPDFDLGSLFKIMFMLAVLSARMRQNDPRVHILGALVIAGFMVQTGYASFLYRFFVKENYPGRIWNGEEIDEGRELLERRRVVARERRREFNLPGLPRPIQDALLFIASFFLSIFPMWQPPQEPPPVAQDGEEQVEEPTDDDGVADGNQEDGMDAGL